jgi:hypothetical protein
MSSGGYAGFAVRFAVPAVLTAALVLPASAAAAPTITLELQRSSVRYGAAHHLSGALVDGALPLAAQGIVLEGKRYPYRGSYRVIARTTTDAQGRFEFRRKLDRNHRLRAVAVAQMLASTSVMAYTLPAFELSFRALRPGVVRLTQRYTVPKSVRLKSPTLFYLGPRGAERAKRKLVAKVKRVRRGHYRSRASFTLPASWHGAFRYASCFRTSKGSGMGNPRQRCPHLRLRF